MSALLTSALRSEIAAGIDECLADWNEGRSTSPDDRDYVLVADRILVERGVEFEIVVEDVADELNAWMIEATPESSHAIAAWLLGRLLPLWRISDPTGDVAVVSAVDARRALDEYSEQQGFAPYTGTEMEESVYGPSGGFDGGFDAGAPFTNYEIGAIRLEIAVADTRANLAASAAAEYATTQAHADETLAGDLEEAAESYAETASFTLLCAGAIPAEIDVENIAEEALAAAFQRIHDRVREAGFSATGDVMPGELLGLERAFATIVRSVCANITGEVASAEEDADKRARIAYAETRVESIMPGVLALALASGWPEYRQDLELVLRSRYGTDAKVEA